MRGNFPLPRDQGALSSLRRGLTGSRKALGILEVWPIGHEVGSCVHVGVTFNMDLIMLENIKLTRDTFSFSSKPVRFDGSHTVDEMMANAERSFAIAPMRPKI